MNSNGVYKWIAGVLMAVLLSTIGYAVNAIDVKVEKVTIKVEKQQEKLHKLDKETSTAIVETKVKLDQIERQGKELKEQIALILKELRSR